MSVDVKTTLLRAIAQTDSANYLASHFPEGILWTNVFNSESNMGRLVTALAVEYYRLGLLTEEISIEMDIRQAVALIDEWEDSVGIPNTCLFLQGTLAERRRNIEGIFCNFQGVQTKADFIRVAALFGYTVTIETGTVQGGFPLEFPLMFFSSSKAAKFTIIVTTPLPGGVDDFPLPFPIPFNAGGLTLLKCIFDLLVPANVKVIVRSIT